MSDKLIQKYLSMSESMFLVLMCFFEKPTFGIEIVETIKGWTNERIKMGPGTLYTILGKFEKDDLIVETEVEGRKRTYAITQLGREIYELELNRIHSVSNLGQIIKEEFYEKEN